MTPHFTLVRDLLAFQPIPEDGILTRQVHEDDRLRVVMFTFSAGQRLSEHTAGTTAILHFLSGEAVVTLGDQTIDVQTGAWVRMDPGLRHAVVTKSPVVMLLTLVKKDARRDAP